MDTGLNIRIFITILVWVVSEAATCTKTYADNTTKTFTCDECCGGTYTRYCCIPPEQMYTDGNAGLTLDPAYIVIIVFAVIVLIAVIIGIGFVVACCVSTSVNSRKETYRASQPPTIVVHQDNAEHVGYVQGGYGYVQADDLPQHLNP